MNTGDIVERLMLGYRDERMTSGELHKTAAEEITRLRAELDKMQKTAIGLLDEKAELKKKLATLKATFFVNMICYTGKSQEEIESAIDEVMR